MKVKEEIIVDREDPSFIVEHARRFTKINESIAPLNMNKESETSGRVVINGISNSGYMLQCLGHLEKSEELIASLDMVEQNVKDEEAIVVDRENPNCIVEHVRLTKNESQFFSGSKFCPPHLQMKFGIKNPPDPKLSSSIILPSSGDMCIELFSPT